MVLGDQFPGSETTRRPLDPDPIDLSKSRITWQMGPAFFAVMAQTIAGIIAVTMLYAGLNNTAANTKATADHLETIVERMQAQQGTTGERLVKVETKLDTLGTTVSRIDAKLDTFKR